jgi:DNA-binding NtrC family response regulator
MLNRKSIIVIEDDASLASALRSVLEHAGYTCHVAHNGVEGLDVVRMQPVDCILTDFRLPDMDGLEVVKGIRAGPLATPIIMMTAYGSVELAVQAMKEGANDFIPKPFEPVRLLEVLSQVIKHKQIVERRVKGDRRSSPRALVSHTPRMTEILHEAARAARVDTSVLITGESGTGKELLARYIHDRSSRNNEPFVAVNCGAIPEALLESEFFGHEAGAYTGATQERTGLFEYASSGTLFLDEIGEMPHLLQVKLLRVIQEQEIRRVGSNKVIRVAPRIIAATNRAVNPTDTACALREDLYYRLSVFTFQLPPLRERREDIADLTDYFIETLAQLFGKRIDGITSEARAVLRAYSYPGNIRELENIIERALILSSTEIRPEHLGLPLEELELGVQSAVHSLSEVTAAAVRSAESKAIHEALIRCEGNKTRAAELLGISYKTMLVKIKEYQREGRGDECADKSGL